MFGADDPNENLANLAVDGMLTLGDGVTAFARSMTVGGARARGRRTYGSSSSAARITDNAHFGGAGTAMSIFKDGFILCIE